MMGRIPMDLGEHPNPFVGTRIRTNLTRSPRLNNLQLHHDNPCRAWCTALCCPAVLTAHMSTFSTSTTRSSFMVNIIPVASGVCVWCSRWWLGVQLWWWWRPRSRYCHFRFALCGSICTHDPPYEQWLVGKGRVLFHLSSLWGGMAVSTRPTL